MLDVVLVLDHALHANFTRIDLRLDFFDIVQDEFTFVTSDRERSNRKLVKLLLQEGAHSHNIASLAKDLKDSRLIKSIDKIIDEFLIVVEGHFVMLF